MKLSTKGRYAVRILLHLALSQKSGPVQKSDISRAEDISEDYIEQILVKLKTSGLVRSQRGVRGGFSLGKAPQQITIADIVLAAEGPIAVAPCVGGHCKRESKCVTKNIWRGLSETIEGSLRKVTLQQIAEDAAKLRDAQSVTFEI